MPPPMMADGVVIGVASQAVILCTLLFVRDERIAGILHTLCAAVYFLAHDDEDNTPKALDVITEATIATSDIFESQLLRLLSVLLCAVRRCFSSELTFSR